jgi:hypothetical protein
VSIFSGLHFTFGGSHYFILNENLCYQVSNE